MDINCTNVLQFQDRGLICPFRLSVANWRKTGAPPEGISRGLALTRGKRAAEGMRRWMSRCITFRWLMVAGGEPILYGCSMFVHNLSELPES